MRKLLILFLTLFGGAVLAVSPAFKSFNNGYVAPSIEARSKYEKYLSSCRTLENMFVYTHGPITRRPGTQYVGLLPGEIDFPGEIAWPPMYIVPAASKWAQIDSDHELSLVVNSYDPEDSLDVTESMVADITSDGSIVAVTNNTDNVDSMLTTYDPITGEVIVLDFIPDVMSKSSWGTTMDIVISSDDNYVYATGSYGGLLGQGISKFAISDGSEVAYYDPDPTLPDKYLGGGNAITLSDDDEVFCIGGKVADSNHYQVHLLKTDLSGNVDGSPDRWQCYVYIARDMVYDSELGFVYIAANSNYGSIIASNTGESADDWDYYTVFACDYDSDTVYKWKDGEDHLHHIYHVETYNGYVYVIGTVAGDSSTEHIWKLSSDLSETVAETSVDVDAVVFLIDTYGKVCTFSNGGWTFKTYSSDDLSYESENSVLNDDWPIFTFMWKVGMFIKPCVIPSPDEYDDYVAGGGDSITIDANNNAVRLIPFEYSTDDSYALMLGDGFMGFYRTDANNDPGQILQ